MLGSLRAFFMGASAELSALEPVIVTNLTDLQTALNSSAALSSGYAIKLIPGIYTLSVPIDVRDQDYLDLDFSGCRFACDATAMANKPMFDLTDSRRVSWFGGYIDPAITSNRPSCGILLARNSADAGAGGHQFYGVNVTGQYEIAGVINDASEVNEWIGCEIINQRPGSAGTRYAALFIGSGSPVGRTTGALETIGSNTMLGQVFLGCTFMRHSIGGGSELSPDDCIVWVQAVAADGVVGNLTWQDCQFASTSNTVDGSGRPTNSARVSGQTFYVYNSNTIINDISVRNCRGEVCTKTVMYLDNVAGTPSMYGLYMTDNVWSGPERLLVGEADFSLRGYRISDTCSSQAAYEWSYNVDGITEELAAGDGDNTRRRCLVDLAIGQEGVVRIGSRSTVQHNSGTNEGIPTNRNASEGGTYTAWSEVRIRTTSGRNRFECQYATDVLTPIVGVSSVVTHDEIFPMQGVGVLRANSANDGIRIKQYGADQSTKWLELEPYNYGVAEGTDNIQRYWNIWTEGPSNPSGTLTRKNRPTVIGYNMDAGGGSRENTGDVAFGWRWEDHYNPSGTNRWVEHHTVFNSRNGTSYRAMGFHAKWTTAASDTAPTIDMFHIIDNKEYFTTDSPASTARMDMQLNQADGGPRIRFLTNDNGTVYTYISCKRGSDSNRMALVGAFGDEVLIGYTGSGQSDNAGIRLHCNSSDELTLAKNGANFETKICAGGSSNRTLSFFGATPIARPTAYTQTYSTATRTHSNLTSATLTDSSGGTANTTVQALTNPTDSPASADALRDNLVATLIPELRNNFADLAASNNAIIVDLTNLKQVVNQIIDDLQSYGQLA